MANALSFLDQSYAGHLLVEDPRTYDYFSTLFNASTATIQIVPVGGSDGVKGLVNASWQHDAQSPVQAYGWIDCDFGDDNVIQWGNRDTHVFRGTRHEIENYLLDWDALANCDLSVLYKKQNADYRGKAVTIARNHLYASVCAHVLYRLQREYMGDFPASPKCAGVTTRQAVQNYIQNQPWFVNRVNSVGALLSPTEINRRIDAAEALYDGALKSSADDWRILFPGKEIFEELVRQVYCGPKAAGGCVRVPDLVKSIARYQSEHGIPQELQNFMAEIKKRMVKSCRNGGRVENGMRAASTSSTLLHG